MQVTVGQLRDAKHWKIQAVCRLHATENADEGKGRDSVNQQPSLNSEAHCTGLWST